jgi:hypothetical protein
VAPEAEALAEVIDRLPDWQESWEFDAAWQRLDEGRADAEYARRLLRVAGGEARG